MKEYQVTWKGSLNQTGFNAGVAKETNLFLDSLASQFRLFRKQSMKLSDSISYSIVNKIGEKRLIKLKNDYYNNSLGDIVLDRNNFNDKTYETKDKIIQKFEPAFMKPVSRSGRAALYSPYKQLGKFRIDTVLFDLLILWFASLVMYIVLYFNGLRKLFSLFDNLKFRSSIKQANKTSSHS